MHAFVLTPQCRVYARANVRMRTPVRTYPTGRAQASRSPVPKLDLRGVTPPLLGIGHVVSRACLWDCERQLANGTHPLCPKADPKLCATFKDAERLAAAVEEAISSASVPQFDQAGTLPDARRISGYAPHSREPDMARFLAVL